MSNTDAMGNGADNQYNLYHALSPAQGCTTPLPQPIKVVGCGSSGVDYLASVAAYPKPDQKLRTETLEVGTRTAAKVLLQQPGSVLHALVHRSLAPQSPG
jgi:hypothetical protein